MLLGAAALSWSCAAGDQEDAGSLDGGAAQVGASADAATVADSPAGEAASDGGSVVSGDDAGDAGSPATGSDDAGQRDDASAIDGAQTGNDAQGPDDAQSPRDASADVTPAADAGAADSGAGGQDASMPTDAGGGGSDAAGCGPVTIVVNEVQTSGSGGAEDEWVELFNPQSCVADVSGWELRHTSINGTSVATVFTAAAGTQIGPKGYGVVGGLSYSASAPTIGGFTTGVLSDTGGGLGLYDAAGTLVASMGYGSGASNPFVESSAAPVEGSGQSIARLPNGAETGNDGADFKTATPSPGAAN